MASSTETETVPLEERKESIVDISEDLQEFIKRVAADLEEREAEASAGASSTSPQIPLPKIQLGDAPYVKAIKYWKRKVYKTKIVLAIFLKLLKFFKFHDLKVC